MLSYKPMVEEKIIKNLSLSLKKIGTPQAEINLEIPANFSYGDYSTSLPLKLAGVLKKKPLDIAAELKANFPTCNEIEKIDVVAPGFVNFWVTKEKLIDQSKKTITGDFDFPKFHLGKNKKIMVEFAHPNTLKLFHIGHLRNISTGESIVRILEAGGNKVVRSNYQGDVGLHIAKCLYGLKSSKFKVQSAKTIDEKIKLIGKAYTVGTRAYEDDPKAKEEILDINRKIYEKDASIMPLWDKTRKWSLEYFDNVYKRVYSHFDRLYFESESYERGMEICKKALKKGILEKSQGAIVFNGKKYGLDTRVFINSQGFPTYEGKEVGLAEKEFSDFGEIDKNIHCVTPEQASFFKVTFKVEELLNEKKYKGKQYHLAYNWVNLKEGKMSSRVGNIIEGPWLIDETKRKIMEKSACDQETAEVLAVAAIKYSFLKQSIADAIAFDLDESISVAGNSAPYLIYTYVRCQSVLKKNDVNLAMEQFNNETVGNDELTLLRKLYQFPSVVLKAATTLSPNIIANYIYELASSFNIFYQKNPILKADAETKKTRLLVTAAIAAVIKKGLDLLGIKTVKKM